MYTEYTVGTFPVCGSGGRVGMHKSILGLDTEPQHALIGVIS